MSIISKMARKAAKRAANVAEDQKGKINRLESMSKSEQSAAGMGTASKARTTLAELGAKTKGQAQSLKTKMRQLNAIEDKGSEKAQLLRNAIKDLKSRLPASVVKQVTESLDMNKGGAVKKAMMMRGGMANKKEHMYAAGGSVMDNLTSAQRNMVKKMAAANKK